MSLFYSATVLRPSRPHQGVYLPVPHVLQTIYQAFGPCWVAEGSRYVLVVKLQGRVSFHVILDITLDQCQNTCLWCQLSEELLWGLGLSFLFLKGCSGSARDGLWWVWGTICCFGDWIEFRSASCKASALAAVLSLQSLDLSFLETVPCH